MTDTLNIFGKEAVLEAQRLSGVEQLMLMPNQTEGWIGFGLLLFFLFSLRFIYYFFYQSRAELLHLHITLKHFEENNLISRSLRQTLLLLSLGITAFVLLLLVGQSDAVAPVSGSLAIYWLFFAALAAFYFLKTWAIRILGYFSETTPYMRMIVYYSQLHIISGSLFVFPLLIILFNRQDTVFEILKFGTIIICVSMYLFYLMRCWQIFRVANVFVFFRILYLCTLEFVPFLIIYKYISQV